MTEDKNTCPHIISSDEGTSYCDLAGKTAEYIADLEKRLSESDYKRNKYSSEYYRMLDDMEEMRELWIQVHRLWSLEESMHRGMTASMLKENANLRTRLHDAMWQLQRLSRKP